MHNHDNNNSAGGHDSKMMWIMMLACFVPIIFLALIGRGVGTNSIWWPFGAGVVMLGLHVYTMRGHGHRSSAGVVTASNQAVASSVAKLSDSNTQQPTAGPSATNGRSKHDCC